ncbi:hypothetical protein VSS74_01510 [Conexibacter stalactiti]|uniref:Zinc finger CHC2-type domain-containing protein n=1 Tax=Conexibacter stalactiti TaxID=1940611 RepID=A0ABU4HIB6_9ACTN|nr:hypothetical protein [Conexibacter stalactiti]MDW5592995.1 hypothetical protein [Conexibacter stalactiti]MEC5033636.1 hypothetical protein [Conexibacter stalactiti]
MSVTTAPRLASSARERARRAAVAVGDDPTAEVELPCQIRLPGGQVYDGEMPAWRHRRLHLSLLHGGSDGIMELGCGRRPPGGKTRWSSRDDEDSFLPGGARAGDHAIWLDQTLARVAAIAARPRTEVAVVPSVRSEPSGGKAAVASTSWLWLDVDLPEALPRLYELLLERPPHLRVESAGSGGEHAYWKLDRPLPARMVDPRTGEVQEWIERAHLRLVRRVGRWAEVGGRPKLLGADQACVDRGRLMRLSGTVNYKRGRHARIISADLARPSYRLRDLVGGLPDLRGRRRPRRVGSWVANVDPYKRIPPADYFLALAGVEVPDRGLVRCPAPDHDDAHASCNVGDDASIGWWCHGCARGGSIYDLASMLLGGPTGAALRGADFRAAKALVVERFGHRG